MANISFASVKTLANAFGAVLKRFPLEMLFAVIGAVAAIQGTLPDHSNNDTQWIRLVMTCNLGLVFSLSATTFTASLRTVPAVTWTLRLLVVAGAVVYFLNLPPELVKKEVFRFFLLAAAGHLLVSVAPFWERGNIGSFWYYNKTLFLRFLTAVLYSAVLFAGLAVALLALNELFALDIPDYRYLQLWIVIAAIVNTALFLAGVPKDPFLSEEIYPRALQVFTQYILIPLVSVYVLILLAYEIKILIQWDLPRGWVSNLIIAFAVVGVLSLLLVFPVRNSSENKWIVWFAKVFHWLLLPLVALLFVAIGTRLAEYGFTEARFIVLATGVWLLFTAIYYLSGRQENIKMIPASLIVFILVTVTLAFPVSLSSQQKRMLSILERNQLLERAANGKVQVKTATTELPLEDRQELTSIVNYLYRTYGREPFGAHFRSVPQRPAGANLYSREFADSLLSGIGTSPAYGNSRFGKTSNSHHFTIGLPGSHVLPANGFDYLISTPSSEQSFRGTRRMQAGEHVIEETFSRDDLRITLTIDDTDSLHFELKSLLPDLVNRHAGRGEHRLTIDPVEASMERETNRYRVRLYLSEMSGSAEVNAATGTVHFDRINLKISYLLEFKN